MLIIITELLPACGNLPVAIVVSSCFASIAGSVTFCFLSSLFSSLLSIAGFVKYTYFILYLIA